MRRALLVGMILGVMGGLSVDASAVTWQNMYPTNNTGGVANDLEKWLVGDVPVSDWLSWHFPEFVTIYDPPPTI